MFFCQSCSLGPTLATGILTFSTTGISNIFLNNNSISRIEPHAISGFGPETTIHLHNNEVTELAEEVFRPMLQILSQGSGKILLVELWSGWMSTLILISTQEYQHNLPLPPPVLEPRDEEYKVQGTLPPFRVDSYSIGEIKGIAVRLFERLPGEIHIENGVGKPSRLSDDRDGPIFQSDHLCQSAGLKDGGDNKHVRSGINQMCQFFLVVENQMDMRMIRILML
ncbi:unnamed protein product, partial [Darwinula stevensoni]